METFFPCSPPQGLVRLRAIGKAPFTSPVLLLPGYQHSPDCITWILWAAAPASDAVRMQGSSKYSKYSYFGQPHLPLNLALTLSDKYWHLAVPCSRGYMSLKKTVEDQRWYL